MYFFHFSCVEVVNTEISFMDNDFSSYVTLLSKPSGFI